MKITVKNAAGTSDITELVLTASISGDYQQASRTLSFSVVSASFDQSIPKPNIQLGDMITLYEGDKQQFSGWVFTRQKSSSNNSVEITCHDAGIYLLRNAISRTFKKLTPEIITQKICAEFAIPVGSLAQTGVSVTRNFIGQNKLYDIIMTCYTLAHNKNEKNYIVRFDNGKLCVLEKGDKSNTQVLESGYNLLSADVTESIENMVNRVVIYNKDDKLVTNIDNTADIKKYGLMQDIYKCSDNEDYKAAAKEKLQQEDQKISVTNFGNQKCITGNSVVVREPKTGLYGLFYIDGDKHTWKNGIYTNSLTLNFKNLMDKKEVGSLPSVKNI